MCCADHLKKETYRTRLWTHDERLGDRQRPRVEMSDRGWGAARGGGAGRCLAGHALLGSGCWACAAGRGLLWPVGRCSCWQALGGGAKDGAV
ncbi:hypothetical protein ACOSQ2_010821 [Xanthoceras sorbifolium]